MVVGLLGSASRDLWEGKEQGEGQPCVCLRVLAIGIGKCTWSKRSTEQGEGGGGILCEE